MTPDEFADRLEAAATRIPDVVTRSTTRAGQALLQTIRRNASGRPGPNVITGGYRASWRTETVESGTASAVDVGTEAPMGRRLEFGFVGSDSLGRVYNQPPFPHVGPAVAEAPEQVVGIFGEAMPEVFE